MGLCSANCQQLNLTGNVSYLREKKEAASMNNKLNYEINLLETINYKLSVSNAICVDLDCFSNEIKEANVFTTLKLEF